jgi:hypothetical protein
VTGQTDLPQSSFRGQFLNITTFGIAFYQSNLSTGSVGMQSYIYTGCSCFIHVFVKISLQKQKRSYTAVNCWLGSWQQLIYNRCTNEIKKLTEKRRHCWNYYTSLPPPPLQPTEAGCFKYSSPLRVFFLRCGRYCRVLPCWTNMLY